MKYKRNLILRNLVRNYQELETHFFPSYVVTCLTIEDNNKFQVVSFFLIIRKKTLIQVVVEQILYIVLEEVLCK